MKSLITVGTKFEADNIINLLKQYNIMAYATSKGAGEYLNIMFNQSIYGEDVMVDDSDIEEATTILTEHDYFNTSGEAAIGEAELAAAAMAAVNPETEGNDFLPEQAEQFKKSVDLSTSAEIDQPKMTLGRKIFSGVILLFILAYLVVILFQYFVF